MTQTDSSTFVSTLLRPSRPGNDDSWAFILLPKDASAILPRRGRTSVQGSLNGHPFHATLEPDGQLSHWLKVGKELQEVAGVQYGERVTVHISPVDREPEPTPPDDLQKALDNCSEAKAVWESTTTIARVDWIHWIESAKQARTRSSRIASACDMLANGKKRVCCFDQSGYYSKGLCAPETAG